ncbi:hypothetical protein [Nonomuraea sp. NPDC046570]|uniref:trypsin-like serine peptidase n=1 Tax=Nonomuraea sp. NPDC046570 TaxID=3155255 RepID=UPI0033C91A6D
MAGMVGAALLGATPAKQHEPSRPAPASRAAERADVVEHVAARSHSAQRRVLDYWTPRRMAAALPISLLDTLAKKSGPPGKRGKGGVLGGLTGKGGKGGVLSGLTGKAGLATAPDLSGAQGKVVTPRRQSARPSAMTGGSRWGTGGLVSRATGRIFLTMDGVDFVCSASTVKSANKDLVVTAGHCVKDGAGAWADNWTFVPGYRTGGERPYGSYTARRMFVAGPWSRSGDDSFDVGMVALNRSGGRHATDVVGYQNIAFNRSRGGQIYGFGFPADAPYDGEHLVYCAGRLREDPYGQTRDQGVSCDMTAGSSGGPWLTDFDAATGRGTIVSLSSFKYSDNRNVMYGPYFGDSAKALFTMAERA